MKKTILLADRDATTILFEKMVLGESAYHFLTATTIRDAVALTIDCHPDLILVDDTMPDRTGLGICRALRSACESAGTPIVILSGTSAPDLGDRIREAGCDAHVRKPISARELQRVVHSMLEGVPAG